MTLLAQKSRSLNMIAAAHIVPLSWCFTFFWHYYFHGTGITWGYAVIDASVAIIFCNQAKTQVFALPLFYAQVAFVICYLLTTIFDIRDWWVMAISNRLFEAEILYIAACALFRIRSLQRQKKGAPAARP